MVRSSYFRDETLRLGKRKMAFPWDGHTHTKRNTEIQTDLDLLVPEQLFFGFFFVPIEISPKHVQAHMHTPASIPTAGIRSY